MTLFQKCGCGDEQHVRDFQVDRPEEIKVMDRLRREFSDRHRKCGGANLVSSHNLVNDAKDENPSGKP